MPLSDGTAIGGLWTWPVAWPIDIWDPDGEAIYRHLLLRNVLADVGHHVAQDRERRMRDVGCLVVLHLTQKVFEFKYSCSEVRI